MLDPLNKQTAAKQPAALSIILIFIPQSNLKTMHRYIVFTAFVFFCLTAAAQKRSRAFEASAKIILLNNDTLYGTTMIDTIYTKEDFKGSNIGQEFSFKQAGQDRFKRYHPKELNGFQIKTADSAWAEFISSQTLPDFVGENFYSKVFLLKMLEGNMSVYYYFYIDETRKNSFFDEDRLTKILYKKGAPKIFHTEIYDFWQSRLVTFVKDCPELAGKLKAVKCKGWSYLQIAAYYNDHCK